MKELTKEQKIIITGFTGKLCCDFADFHEDLECRLGYPVMTHMLGDRNFIDNHVEPAYKEDFMLLVGAKPQ